MGDINLNGPRQETEQAIATGNLPKLLEMAAVLHGHFCGGLASGVKAAARAMKELGTSSTGMEEVIAIVETNSCFSDGIQFVTGCSFGNNALIYRDYGKTAFTLARRSGEAIRISTKAERRSRENRDPEMTELFQKVVEKRQGTDTDRIRLSQLQWQVSFRILDIPEDKLFNIRRLTIQVPEYAHIFASVKCSICGENIMEPRARVKDGKPICIQCSGQDYYQLSGDGMAIDRH